MKAREEARGYYRRIFERMEAFNANVSGNEPGIPQSKIYLLSGMNESDVPSNLHPVLDQYAAVDALAIKFREQTTRTQFLLHITVFSAFLCFVVAAHLHAHLGYHRTVWLIVASVILVAVARVEARRAKREEQDTKHQDYRALAEGLRVKFFWLLAGLDEPVADHYLGKQRTELDWIRNGFRGWNIGGPRAIPSADALRRVELVLQHWVADQHGWFTTKAENERKRAENREHLVGLILRGAVVIGLFLSVAFLCTLSSSYFAHSQVALFGEFVSRQLDAREKLPVDVSIIFIDLLLAAGALIHHYSERMAYSEHAKQYSRMEKIFAYASTAIRNAVRGHDVTGAREVLLKLGKEALAENGDWVLLHRERPLELPHP